MSQCLTWATLHHSNCICPCDGLQVKASCALQVLFLKQYFFGLFFYKCMYILLVVLHFSLIRWLLLIMHEIRAELKVDTECGQRTIQWQMSETLDVSVTEWLMSDMLKWGYEARPCDIYQPIFWWCNICRSIVGQHMFLSLCLVLWLGLEIWDLNACCLWQYYGKGDLSMTCCF